MVLDTLPAQAKPINMQVDGRSLRLEKSPVKNAIMGYEQFANQDSLGKPQLLKLKIQFGEELLTLRSQEIPLKQTINYPSAPPRN